MAKIEITLTFDSEKMDALEYALRKERTTVQKQMDEALRQLYETKVPEAVRDYLDNKNKPMPPKDHPGIPKLPILLRRSETQRYRWTRPIEADQSERVNSSQKSLSPVNGKFGVDRKKYEDKGPPWCAPAVRPQSPAVRGFFTLIAPPSVLRF